MSRRKNAKRRKPNPNQQNSAGDSESKDRPGSSAYLDIIKENELFQKYYKNLLKLEENEWTEFLNCLKEPLPTTFRITGSDRNFASAMKSFIEEKFLSKMENIKSSVLPWYPEGLGFCVDVDRKTVRKDPIFSGFHKFLVGETEIGHISRQEAVSMIPPLLLNVKSHHKVLDMCAAPGSKTTQILEAMHSDCLASNSFPTGVVIANDADPQRAYTLVHQAKRLSSPCLLVSNHDGTQFPTLYYQTAEKGSGKKAIQFDRILCDVPCSGDGTLRKNPLLWRNWNPSIGVGLHSLQIKIFERAFNLLKDGGRIVYSTCSLNPVENEAVVCHIMNKFKETIKLVDVSEDLKGLHRECGMKSWALMDSKGAFYSSWDEVVSPVLQKSWSETMFPPANIDEMPIERCMRLLPHKQNTGGFFVSVFEKIASIDKQVSESLVDEDEKPVSSKTANGVYRPGAVGKGAFKEEPFVFLDYDSNPYLAEIKNEFELKDDFPLGQLMIRQENTTAPKVIYVVSAGVKDFLLSNNSHQFNAINTGVKAFSRCTDKLNSQTVDACPYRFQHDSIALLGNRFERRSYKVSVKDMLLCLSTSEERHDFSDFESCSAWEALPVGSLIFSCDSPCGKWKTAACVWKGKSTIQAMVNAAERASLSRLLKMNE